MNRGDMTYTAGTKKDNQDVQEQGQELGSAPRDSFFLGQPRLQQDLFSHGA